ncbi:MAG: hypothetical protein MJ179_00300 [Treponema sp.]|nr:hypothetical protein [Treponema sp.]
MIYLNAFFYYVCFASSILIYGIGLNKTADVNTMKNKDIIYFGKVILTILVSSILSWLIADKLLVPLKLAELYPFTSLLVYVFISMLFEMITRYLTKKSSTEFVLSYLTVLLSVSESTALVNTIVISLSTIIAMLLFVPLVYSFRKRNLKDIEQPEVYMSRLFIFIAIIILVISSWDFMWINPEVF